MEAEKSSDSGGGVLSTRFELAESSESVRRYQRIISEPSGLNSAQYHVAEIVEQRYPDRKKVIRAIKEGEADMVPSVLPWEIDGLLASEDLATVRYALPMTHVIVFNPMSEHASLTQLRRALALAVDREAILQKTVLRDPQMRHGRVTTSVWNQASYATNPAEKPLPSDFRLAFTLRFAAEKQLQLQALQVARDAEKAELRAAGQPFDEADFLSRTKVDHVRLPVLRMVVEADVVAAAAAEKIVQYWKRIGIEVQLVSLGKKDEKKPSDATWDLMYRRVRLEEPLLDLWPLLTNDSRCDVMRLKAFPDWLRQELIALDYAATFSEAQRRMHQIHRHLVAQAFAIPLWEVDDYVVFHKNVAGFSKRPVSSYQNVERWVVRP
jgi:ABC-type transport system substrate-binding protein